MPLQGKYSNGLSRLKKFGTILTSSFLISILLPALICFSGELPNRNESEEGDAPLNRIAVFYNQRAFPGTTIPAEAYNKAVRQTKSLGESNGYLSPTGRWTCIGPAPGNLGGMPIFDITGRVAAVKFFPGDPTGMTFYIGGADGGIWKTTNGGVNWEPKSDNISSLSTGAIAFGKNAQGEWTNLYYGTGESHAGFNFCYYGDGFYKSTNNGDSWQQINDPNLPQRPTYFSRIVVNPVHPNIVLAACGTNHTNISYQAGLYLSTDYGETWKKVAPDPKIQTEGRVCNDVVISPYASPNGTQMAYATGPDESSTQIYEKGINYQISTDGGLTWTMRNDIINLQGRSHIALCRDFPNYVFILTGYSIPCGANGFEWGVKVYFSSDRGYSFAPEASFVGMNCSGSGGDAYQAWYDMFISVGPTNPSEVYVGLINLWKSNDGGLTFPGYITPEHKDMQAMDFAPNDPLHMVVGGDGGIYSTLNGGASLFDNLNNGGLVLTQFYRVASSPFNPDVVIGGAQDNGFQSKYPGTNAWHDAFQNGNDGTTVYYSMLDPYLVFACYGNSGDPFIIRSTNGGLSFLTNFLPQNQIWDSQNDWVPPITSVVDNLTFTENFYTARRCNVVSGPFCSNGSTSKIKFFRTLDKGNTWSEFGEGICNFESPQELAISQSNPQVMYFSTGSYAWPYVAQNLYKSVDGGNTWNKIIDGTSNTDVPNRYMTHIEISLSDENLAYITLSGFNSQIPEKPGHIFRTTNGGLNWNDMSGNLPDVPVNDLVIEYNDDKSFIAATDAGVLVTTNKGANWSPLAPNLPQIVVTDLEYHPFTGKLRAATFGRGVWEFDMANAACNIDYTAYLNSDADGFKIPNDLVVESGGKIVIPYSCTIKMGAGKKIIIKDGGSIEASNGATVIFTCETGTWGGIEFQGSASGDLFDCTFLNSEFPVSIMDQSENTKGVILRNCSFYNGSVNIVSGKNVRLENSSFHSSSHNISSAINIINSSKISVTGNTITESPVGILVSGSSTMISDNSIDKGGLLEANAYCGISLENSYSGYIAHNVVNGYKNSVYLFNSDPYFVKDNETSDKNGKSQKQSSPGYTFNSFPLFITGETMPLSFSHSKLFRLSDIPVVPDYPEGRIDTLNYVKESTNQPDDNKEFSPAVNYEISGMYSNAIELYKQAIINRSGSLMPAALKRILYCYNEMKADERNYREFRNFLQTVAKDNSSDPGIMKTVADIDTKCLVNLGLYNEAVSEFEKRIISSSDALEVLCAELNLVELYMTMPFDKKVNGKLGYLKPAGRIDGIKKINELLHNIKNAALENNIPSVFSLGQNYPNPFNPSTRIKYSLPVSAKVSLKVYDLLGKLVVTLVNGGLQKAGFYEINFDGSSLSSGVYFYRIEAGNFTGSRKMVILK